MDSLFGLLFFAEALIDEHIYALMPLLFIYLHFELTCSQIVQVKLKWVISFILKSNKNNVNITKCFRTKKQFCILKNIRQNYDIFLESYMETTSWLIAYMVAHLPV